MPHESAEIEKDAEPTKQEEEAPALPLNDVATLRRQVLARERSARGQLPRGRR